MGIFFWKGDRILLEVVAVLSETDITVFVLGRRAAGPGARRILTAGSRFQVRVIVHVRSWADMVVVHVRYWAHVVSRTFHPRGSRLTLV